MIKRRDEKTAIHFRDQKISYKELQKNIIRFSTFYEDIVNKRIAIFSENRLEWIYTFYAAWNTDNLPVPIDYLSGADDVAFILNDCTPELIFCSAERASLLKDALKQVKYEPRLLVFEELNLTTEVLNDTLTIHSDPDKTAVIIYTSGTTGSPKGVMLSYDNLMANIEAVSERVKIYKEEDITLVLLPLHHILPLLGTMILPFNTGGTIAICPSLNADDILRTLQNNKVSILVGVPRLYSLFRKGIVDKINQSSVARILFSVAKKIRSRKFSRFIFKAVHQKFGGSIKCMVSGGAALDPEVGRDFTALGFDILEGFGMTEAAPMITFTRPGKFKSGSPGQPVPGVLVEIRDGEIVAKGRNVMQGYYNREAETDEIIKEGWLYTGDLGYLDKKNRLFITGRKKEIIVLSNGKKINPVEIELKLENSFRFIKEAGVFMQKDKLSVIIVPDIEKMKAQQIEPVEEFFNEEIKRYNQHATASKKLVRQFIYNEELPRTRLGKLQRYKLEGLISMAYKEKSVESSAVNDFRELSTLIGFLEEQTGTKVYPGDRLDQDLALDSLSRITLIVYVENTFGVNIEENNLDNFETVFKLGEYIREKKTRISPEKINWAAILKENMHIHLPKAGFSFNFYNWTYRALFKSFFRLRVEGTSNIPSGPCIIAPNHQSFLDGFVVASLLRRSTMKRTYFYAKEKHWRRSWQRFLARKNNIILMDINKDLKESMQKMAAVLQRGKNLIIFPEGTRSSDGTIGEFKRTFAILSHELNVPVVPVVINGAHKAFPVGSFFPRFFRIVSVKFLQPVYPVNHTYDTLKQQVQTMVAAQLSSKKLS
jgi:long-chain acyl-CoA synthetase